MESLKQHKDSLTTFLGLVLGLQETEQEAVQAIEQLLNAWGQGQPGPLIVSPSQYRRLQWHAEKRSKELERKGIKQPNRAARRRADRRSR